MTWEEFAKRLRPDGDCLIWTGNMDGRGYGQIRLNGVNRRAHRVAYELANGPIKSDGSYHGAVVLHHCDNRPCCNPAHLGLGSHADNMADMVAKGRSARHAGTENGRAVLTPAEVDFIRADARPTRTIARDWPVSRSAIQRIKNGKAWASV